MTTERITLDLERLENVARVLRAGNGDVLMLSDVDQLIGLARRALEQETVPPIALGAANLARVNKAAYEAGRRDALEQEAKPVPVGSLVPVSSIAAAEYLESARRYPHCEDDHDRVEMAADIIDLSDLLDKVYKEAYERGKAERVRLSLFSGLPIDHTETTIANAGTIADAAERERVKELERRDWAVRVLDAKVRALGGANVYWSSNDNTCGIHNWDECEGWHRHGQGEAAARMWAARDIYPTLDAATRADLGECP
jgi:hypothetical protein